MKPLSMPARAFTLIEALVVIAVVALLLSLLAPALSGARDAGRAAACMSNQRQMAAGWALYANAFADRAMPLGDPNGTSEIVYWWGSVRIAPASVEHERGYLSPYLDSGLNPRSVYECPSQPWGTYRAQPMSIPPPGQPTSTYGYNGYYLCPPLTPGWSIQIGRQRWKRLGDIERPTDLFVFADAMLEGQPPRNCALLDPPQLWSSGEWLVNPSPTTSFRHAAGKAGAGNTITARADGGVRPVNAQRSWLTCEPLRIGSAGTENGPHYVPDWRQWR